MTPFQVLLIVHISLAVSLFLPSLLLPFAFRTRRDVGVGSRRPAVRALAWLQSNGTLVIGAGLAVTGVALIAVLGAGLLQQPWLLVALTVYAANLGVAFFIQRPALRRILGVARGTATDDAQWQIRARRHRYVSYLMAGAVGVIAFLMTQKPAF